MATDWQALAISALDALESYGSQGTMDLIGNMGMSATMHNRGIVRRVLMQLMSEGTIGKRGSGKYFWYLLNRQWDRSRPLKSPPKSQTRQQTTVVQEIQTVRVDDEALKEAHQRISELEVRVSQLEAAATTGGKLTIEIKKWDGETIELENETLPAVFRDVMDLATARRPILLVGPAGCGKTYLGSLVAKSLGLEFGSISCTNGTSEVHILGWVTPNLTNGKNRFMTTDFLRIYEGGGVFLFDELDGADPNVLLCINQAISNGHLSVPNRPGKRAERHENFVVIATANTIGRGATRVYAGRNQLDESTLDRFRMGTIECDYDQAVEKAVCPDDGLRSALQGIRRKINEAGLRRIMSTRFMEDAYVMKKSGWTDGRIIDGFFSGWSREETAKVGRAS